MWARRTVALTPITDVTSEELQHAISEAIADAIFLKTHDPAGVIALLLRQGRRVEASTNAEYVEKTALSSKLEAVLDTQPSATAPKPTPKASKWARVRQLHSVGHFGMAGRLPHDTEALEAGYTAADLLYSLRTKRRRPRAMKQ